MQGVFRSAASASGASTTGMWSGGRMWVVVLQITRSPRPVSSRAS